MFFKNEFAFLSNMYKCSLIYKENYFAAAEIAYVYAKCALDSDKEIVLSITNPYEAKKFGRAVKLVDDWDNKRLQVMYDIVFEKFSQNTSLSKRLLAIEGDIVEENTWNDRFWGVCNGSGQNNLGNILMLVRNVLRYNF